MFGLHSRNFISLIGLSIAMLTTYLAFHLKITIIIFEAFTPSLSSTFLNSKNDFIFVKGRCDTFLACIKQLLETAWLGIGQFRLWNYCCSRDWYMLNCLWMTCWSLGGCTLLLCTLSVGMLAQYRVSTTCVFWLQVL